MFLKTYNIHIILLLLCMNVKTAEKQSNDLASLGKCMKTLYECIEDEERNKFGKSIAPKRTAKCVYEKSLINVNPNWSAENLLCHCWNSTESSVHRDITKFLKNREKWEIIMLYGEPYTEEALTEDQNFSSLPRYDKCLPKIVDCLEAEHCRYAIPTTKVSRCLSLRPDAASLLDEMMMFADCFGRAFELRCMQVHN